MMNTQTTTLDAEKDRLGPRAARRREFRELCKLAAPIVATQVAWVAMLTTDTAMIGHLGAEALAGASLSLMVMFIGYTFCYGVTLSTSGLAAQAFGARQPRIVRRVIRQGLWVAVTFVVPSVLIFSQVSPILKVLGQPQELLPHAEAYMSTLMWCLPPAMMFVVLRNFVSALGRPAPAFWIMAAGVPLNAFLDYGLIFGHFGLPRLELVGAGIATTLTNVYMAVAIALVAAWRRPFAKYQVFARFWRPDWHQYGRILRIGLPIAGITVMEAGFFIGAVFVIGHFGAVALAAHMIAIQLPHITFMVPMGLAQAATVRVGQAAGRRDLAGAYRAAWIALCSTALFMLLPTGVILLAPELFASLFLDASRPDTAEVLPFAVSLLLLAAFFQLGDGIQAVAAGALRGVNDTAVPMLIAGFSYWGLGVASGYWFAYEEGMGTHGIWIGFIVGLTAAAVLLTMRVRHQWRRGHLPPPVEDPGL